MKILFAGSDEFSLPVLQGLVDRHRFVGVLTRAPGRSGRGHRIVATRIEEEAHARGLPVLHPCRLDAEARKAVSGLCPDLLLVASYGKIFGPRFLSLFAKGAVNLHPSLLPRYRGPSPIQATILAGDLCGGVSLQYLAEEVDSGDILGQRKVSLSGKECRAELERRLAEEGLSLLEELLPAIATGSQRAVAQKHKDASYTSLLTAEMGEIDWNESAGHIERMLRAYDPWPGVYSSYAGKRLKIISAEVTEENASHAAGTVWRLDKTRGILVQTGNGSLVVKELQREGRKALSWQAFLNGEKDFLRARLGNYV